MKWIAILLIAIGMTLTVAYTAMLVITANPIIATMIGVTVGYPVTIWVQKVWTK